MQRALPRKVVKAVEVFLEKLSSEIRVEEAYLFGSYAKGTWIKTSDVDLIVVSRDFKGLRYTERLDLVNRVQWSARISPFIEVIPLTPEEFRDKVGSSAVIRDASKYWLKIWPRTRGNVSA